MLAEGGDAVLLVTAVDDTRRLLIACEHKTSATSRS